MSKFQAICCHGQPRSFRRSQDNKKESSINDLIQATDTGTVKWFSQKKGYGFIETEAGEEVFVHYSSIQGKGYRVLEPGDKVHFEKVTGPKGLQAYHVEHMN